MLFKLAGDLGLELFKPLAESLQIFARIAHPGLVSLAVLPTDRDPGGIDQLACEFLAHPVSAVVVELGEASGRERVKRLRGGILAQDRASQRGVQVAEIARELGKPKSISRWSWLTRSTCPGSTAPVAAPVHANSPAAASGRQVGAGRFCAPKRAICRQSMLSVLVRANSSPAKRWVRSGLTRATA